MQLYLSLNRLGWPRSYLGKILASLAACSARASRSRRAMRARRLTLAFRRSAVGLEAA